MAAIDVGDLTHDAGTLATELQDGTTRIPVVDGAATGDPALEAGFVRLTDLLVGPTTGTWVGFGQEMLQTLALLPGVVSQGTVTAHSGHRGLGFSTERVVSTTPGPERRWMGLHPRRSSSIRRRGCCSRPGTSPSRSWKERPRISSAVPRPRCTPTAWVTGSQLNGSTRSGRQVLVGPTAIPAWIDSFHLIEAVTEAPYDPRLSAVLDPFLGHGNMAFSDDWGPEGGPHHLRYHHPGQRGRGERGDCGSQELGPFPERDGQGISGAGDWTGGADLAELAGAGIVGVLRHAAGRSRGAHRILTFLLLILHVRLRQ